MSSLLLPAPRATETTPIRAARPVLLVVDDDREALLRTSAELERRYGDDYATLCAGSAAEAVAQLEALERDGSSVAIVLADVSNAGASGAELLARVAELHPHAKRGLLIEWGAWGDSAMAAAIVKAMAVGHADYYVIKPWRPGDEYFHRTIAEFLHEWARAERSLLRELVVVAPDDAPRGYGIRSLLTRNGVPHVFHASDSAEGRQMLRDTDGEPGDAPIVRLLDGRVLVDPSDADVADGYGVRTQLGDAREFDVAVIGAGPAGLAAAVCASSEGLTTLVVERESIGGQAGASSLIRNYPGFPRGVSGAELAQRSYQQAWVFGTTFLLMRGVCSLQVEDGRHLLTFSDGTTATARTVVLASGVSYRRLGVESLDAFSGSGVHYGAPVTAAHELDGESVVVVGGGNSAGQAAMHLRRYAADVKLVVRGASLSHTMSEYLRREIAAAPNVDVHLHTEVAAAEGDRRLERVTLCDNRTGATTTVAAAALFVLIGAEPHTDWLPSAIARDPWGYVLTGSDASSATASSLETSVPGVYAVGDVRCRSVKRVASAVGEGAVVVPQIHQRLAASTPLVASGGGR